MPGVRGMPGGECLSIDLTGTLPWSLGLSFYLRCEALIKKRFVWQNLPIKNKRKRLGPDQGRGKFENEALTNLILRGK